MESKCLVKIKYYQHITDYRIGKNPPQWLLDILFYRLSGVLAPAALHPHYYYPVFPARQLIFSDARDHKLRLIRSAALFFNSASRSSLVKSLCHSRQTLFFFNPSPRAARVRRTYSESSQSGRRHRCARKVCKEVPVTRQPQN